jgi:SAM-dependent methyltransferase
LTHCLICGGTRFRRYAPDFYKLEDQHYGLSECTGCGFVFVQPWPTAEQIAGMYSGNYHQECFDSGLSDGGYFENERKLLRRYEEVVHRIERRGGSGRLLDVGCAGGLLLSVAREHGFRPEGVEICPEMAQQAREHSGCPVHTGTVESVGLDEGAYDVVFMGHVLEHVTDPHRMLRAARRALSDDGLLAVEVPSFINSFYYRGLRAFYRIAPVKPLPMFKIVPAGKHLKPYHLLEFTPKTLRMLLGQEAFTIVGKHHAIPMPDCVLGVPKTLTGWLLKPAFMILHLLTKVGFRGGSFTLFARKTKDK